METIPPLMYTEVELESYIPTGWSLAEGAPSGWDEQQQAFLVTVVDSCDLDWELAVTRAEAAALGRIEALRRTVDRLHRERFKSFL